MHIFWIPPQNSIGIQGIFQNSASKFRHHSGNFLNSASKFHGIIPRSNGFFPIPPQISTESHAIFKIPPQISAVLGKFPNSASKLRIIPRSKGIFQFPPRNSALFGRFFPFPPRNSKASSLGQREFSNFRPRIPHCLGFFSHFRPGIPRHHP